MSVNKIRNNTVIRFVVAVLGSLIYALGMNLFIIPEHVFSGGVMGWSQLFAALIQKIFHVDFGTFDATGLIYYIINIPIVIWGWKTLGKKLVLKTFVCVTALSVFMSFIPIPSSPILDGDILASCAIGGILTGVGIGICLSFGSSLGGLDIVGLILTQKKMSSSIGTLYLVINAMLYSVCFFMYDVKTVIYSIIIAAIVSYAIDRVHLQNINVEAKVITKNLDKTMQSAIMEEMYRGLTRLDCKGAYTEDNEYIFYIVMNKYEVSKLREIVKKHDPNAWIVINEKVSVFGNFIKKL